MLECEIRSGENINYKGSGRENINGRERRRKPPNLTLYEDKEVNGGCSVTMP